MPIRVKHNEQLTHSIEGVVDGTYTKNLMSKSKGAAAGAMIGLVAGLAFALVTRNSKIIYGLGGSIVGLTAGVLLTKNY